MVSLAHELSNILAGSVGLQAVAEAQMSPVTRPRAAPTAY